MIPIDIDKILQENFPDGEDNDKMKNILSEMFEERKKRRNLAENISNLYEDINSETKEKALYLKDTLENREKLTELLGEGCTLFDDGGHIEIYIKAKKWSSTPAFMWLYTSAPKLTTITEVNNLLRKNKIKNILKNNGK